MPAMTPPWQLDPWNLPADLRKIEQQWTALGEILEDPARYELRHAATSGWRCGDQAGHALIAAFGIARGIERALAEPERDQDGKRDEAAGAVLESGIFPRGRVQAPERLDPTGRSREELVAMITPTMVAWSSLASRADTLATSTGRFPHFLFGHLTSAEWVRFCAIHNAHHLALARDIEVAASAGHGHTHHI